MEGKVIYFLTGKKNQKVIRPAEYFAFNKADDGFPARLRTLYAGEKVSMIKGDELATITISLANQLLRYVRESNPGVKLPEVCYKV